MRSINRAADVRYRTNRKGEAKDVDENDAYGLFAGLQYTGYQDTSDFDTVVDNRNDIVSRLYGLEDRIWNFCSR